MILDQTWNKKDQKLTLSYIDKQGNRQFFQKYLHHIKSYEYDDNGEFETWNHRRCNKVYKDTYDYTPNMFDLLEFKYELDIVDKLYENNFPKLYFFDIETEYSNDPALKLISSVSSELLGIDNVELSFTSSNTDALEFVVEEWGKEY